MNSVLVTGSGGLVGYAVASHLSQTGKPVVGLDLPGMTPEEAGFPVVETDLNNIHGLYETLNSYHVDHIVHCGAISGPMLLRNQPFTICQANVLGTINILESARIAQIRRVVYCSSISVYGTTSAGLVTEDAPMHPTTVYGASKAAGDLLLQAYAAQQGLDAVAVRISCVFGPRRRTDCLIRTLIENALAGQPTHLPFGSGFRRQYIYVEDVVAAIIAALEADHLPQRAYNITGGQWLTLDEVAKTVQRIVPGVEYSLAPGPDPIDDIQHPFDIVAANKDLSYFPRYSLEEGIRAYHEWIVAQQKHPVNQ